MRHFRLTGIQNLGDTGSLPSMTDSEDGKNVTELLVSSSGSVTKQNPTSARLYVPQGLDKGKSASVGPTPIVVGAGPDCQLVLQDRTVSRKSS